MVEKLIQVFIGFLVRIFHNLKFNVQNVNENFDLGPAGLLSVCLCLSIFE